MLGDALAQVDDVAFQVANIDYSHAGPTDKQAHKQSRLIPLQELVRRYRISVGSTCRPTPLQQSSGDLSLSSHTEAQLQSKGRDDQRAESGNQ